MNGGKIQILVIEDDLEYVEIVKMCLEEPDSMGLKFELERADRLEVGLKLLEAARFDAVLLDLTLPDSRGIETVERLIGRGLDVPILVMTNLGDEMTAFEAMRLGAQDYMVKATSDSRYLKRAIWYAIERHRLRAQSESIIRKAADGMVVIDADGVVRYVNGAAETIFGKPAAELLGHPFPFPAESGKTAVNKVRAGQKEASIEMKVVEIQWQGREARLASLRDITELQRVEQLKAEIRERRRLDQLKDELIGTVSHELRTPLTIIKGAIDNLREGIAGPLAQRQSEIVTIAARNIDRLAKMINNLLDLSRLESGSSRLNRRPVDLRAVISEIATGLKLADAVRVELRAELPAELPSVDGDPEMLGQVVTNLLDNALRYARGRVVVSAAREGAEVRVDVVDDGPGIPEDKVGSLFNKFVQINRTAGRGYKGTGLGLAICKEILTLHGGRIEVASVVGAGTRFSFRLPVKSAAQADEREAKRT
jgi:signal transduction histidine kinase